MYINDRPPRACVRILLIEYKHSNTTEDAQFANDFRISR